jgi:hypothetical protein
MLVTYPVVSSLIVNSQEYATITNAEWRTDSHSRDHILHETGARVKRIPNVARKQRSFRMLSIPAHTKRTYSHRAEANLKMSNSDGMRSCSDPLETG